MLDIGRPAQEAIATALARLTELLPGRIATGATVRAQHCNTLSWIAGQPPDAVVWPADTPEVQHIVAIARDCRVPLIPYGAGTSLEGQVNAPAGGICVDLSRMKRVLAVNARDLDCRVEAGLAHGELNTHLRDTGLFFPVDPGTPHATLGGMAATRASGTTTVRYGAMRDNVISATAVLADGSIIDTGRRARKSAAGYDLTRLLVGSEGTLGIITALVVRLYPRPEHTIVAVCPFEALSGACEATIEAIATGLNVARIELLDALQIAVVNRHCGLALAERPTLFVEFHGPRRATEEAAGTFRAIAAACGAESFEAAADEGDRTRLWRARHEAFWAVRAAWPGRLPLVTDVCVPVSRLADCVTATADDIRTLGLTAPIVGHVGDGNFHVIPVIDAGDEDQVGQVKQFLERLIDRAHAADGTCSGEHGIGQGKAVYLQREFGAGVDAMRAIKCALDPKGIMNPGKIFP